MAPTWSEAERRHQHAVLRAHPEWDHECRGRRGLQMPAVFRELGPLGDGNALPSARAPIKWHQLPLRAEVLQPVQGDFTPRAYRPQSLKFGSAANGDPVSLAGEPGESVAPKPKGSIERSSNFDREPRQVHVSKSIPHIFCACVSVGRVGF